MKKTLIAVATVCFLLQTGILWAEDIPAHAVDIQEIINIDAKMAEVAKKLRNNPGDTSLNKELRELEAELMSKIDNYESMKEKALKTEPAAGAAQN